MDKIPFVYVLFSGQLYGTERMAIVTAQGISGKYQPILLTPPGLVLAEAEQHQITTQCFDSNWQMAGQLKFYLANNPKLVFVTTRILHSLIIVIFNSFYRRQITHLHVVHGGANEKLSYSRKSLLNPFSLKLIAVSEFVRDRLLSYGVRFQKIEVIENFLLESQIETIPKRQSFTTPGIKRVIIVSRLEPIKRIDLLLDALDFAPALNSLEFRIFGFGSQMKQLQTRVISGNHPVLFEGFSLKILELMANSDLLLHLCPVEPFGLAILEAMAVGLPVLVPDRGGAELLVEDGVSGFQFSADDEQDLALTLEKVGRTYPMMLNSIVDNARKVLKNRFSEHRAISAYLKLLN